MAAFARARFEATEFPLVAQVPAVASCGAYSYDELASGNPRMTWHVPSTIALAPAVAHAPSVNKSILPPHMAPVTAQSQSLHMKVAPVPIAWETLNGEFAGHDTVPDITMHTA